MRAGRAHTLNFKPRTLNPVAGGVGEVVKGG